MNKFTGCLPSPVDIRDFKLKLKNEKLPEEFFIGSIPIKNQNSSPTCVPHTLSEIVEFHNMKNSGIFTRFSTDFIYGLRQDSYKTEGMYIRDGLKVLSNYGDVPYSYLKGNSKFAEKAKKSVENNIEELKEISYPNRISTYYKIDSLKDIKQAVYIDGPVAASMKVYEGYKINNGVYEYSIKPTYETHAVLVVGWTNDSLILQNSWGKFWGNKGYFKILYKDVKNIIYESYGVTDDIDNVIQPNVMKKKAAKFVNKLLNLLR